jgi:hypothetical protein
MLVYSATVAAVTVLFVSALAQTTPPLQVNWMFISLPLLLYAMCFREDGVTEQPDISLNRFDSYTWCSFGPAGHIGLACH